MSKFKLPTHKGTEIYPNATAIPCRVRYMGVENPAAALLMEYKLQGELKSFFHEGDAAYAANTIPFFTLRRETNLAVYRYVNNNGQTRIEVTPKPVVLEEIKEELEEVEGITVFYVEDILGVTINQSTGSTWPEVTSDFYSLYEYTAYEADIELKIDTRTENNLLQQAGMSVPESPNLYTIYLLDLLTRKFLQSNDNEAFDNRYASMGFIVDMQRANELYEITELPVFVRWGWDYPGEKYVSEAYLYSPARYSVRGLYGLEEAYQVTYEVYPEWDYGDEYMWDDYVEPAKVDTSNTPLTPLDGSCSGANAGSSGNFSALSDEDWAYEQSDGFETNIDLSNYISISQATAYHNCLIGKVYKKADYYCDTNVRVGDPPSIFNPPPLGDKCYAAHDFIIQSSGLNIVQVSDPVYLSRQTVAERYFGDPCPLKIDFYADGSENFRDGYDIDTRTLNSGDIWDDASYSDAQREDRAAMLETMEPDESEVNDTSQRYIVVSENDPSNTWYEPFMIHQGYIVKLDGLPEKVGDQYAVWDVNDDWPDEDPDVLLNDAELENIRSTYYGPNSTLY